jgi:hypothetical protein
MDWRQQNIGGFMAVKKSLSLEDVRRNPKLRARFIKEHPESADQVRFEKLVDVMAKPVKKPPKVYQA